MKFKMLKYLKGYIQYHTQNIIKLFKEKFQIFYFQLIIKNI